MKRFLSLFICVIPVFAWATPSHYVKGYTRKDGAYVKEHRATNPNKTQRDNWSSKPNTNPYTGKQGTREPKK